MASRAKGDQPGARVPSGAPVMNDLLIPRPASLAATAITGEDGLAVPGEIPERVPAPARTRAAQECKSRGVPPAPRAEQRALAKRNQNSV